MTPGTYAIVVAMCQRAAELWSEGDEAGADHWTEAAIKLVGGRDFVDQDEAIR